MQVNGSIGIGVLFSCVLVGTCARADQPGKPSDPQEIPEAVKLLQGRWIALESDYVNEYANSVHGGKRPIMHMKFRLEVLTVELEFTGTVGLMRRIYKDGDKLVRQDPMVALLVHANTEPVVCEWVLYRDFLQGGPKGRPVPRCILKMEGEKLYLAECADRTPNAVPRSFDVRNDPTVYAVTIFERVKEK